MEEDVFVKMAPGYEIAKSGVPLVMKLKDKGVRSPAEPEELVRHDGPSPCQNRVPPSQIGSGYFEFEDDTGFVILALYVDDVLLMGGNEQLLKRIKKQLMDRFEMTGMDDVSRVLGMNVTHDSDKGMATFHYVKTQDHLADIRTKHFNTQRQRELINTIRDFGA